MITSLSKQQEYYHALLTKNPHYDGIFFAGITTTGIFCHATCPAKKPKFENCQFYQTAEEALLAGFRPCKRCHPLSYPHSLPKEIKTLVAAVEKTPEKRWQERDFHTLGLHSATARRKFKDIYGMTFVQYARSRRMGLAFNEIINGKKVIDQQLAAGYDSPSAFNDAFTKIMGNPPKKTAVTLIYGNLLETPIGPMFSLSTEESLYLLEFTDRRGLEKEIETLRKKHNGRIVVGDTKPNQLLKAELALYFSGQLTDFTVPLKLVGSDFQLAVWQALKEIPCGQTRSYSEIAQALGKNQAFRAIGNANGANQLAIIIPCHRVIKTDGQLGGYGGGLERKAYLLALEKKQVESKITGA